MPDVPDLSEVEFEGKPLTRAEYISAMVHLYRGEMHRSLIWRQRMDLSTNWAVFTAAAMLSFLFSKADNHHVVAILGIVIIFVMLCYEARRFRYFNVWRARVRMMEENFYGPMLRRDLTSPVQNWAFVVAEDLMTPRFRFGYLTALRARLIRNYIPLFMVLFAAWTVKITMHPVQSARLEWQQLMETTADPEFVPLTLALSHTQVGFVPAWAVNGLMCGFAAFLLLVGIFARPRHTQEQKWWSARSDESVDEVS